jgi:hypothetical protein
MTDNGGKSYIILKNGLGDKLMDCIGATVYGMLAKRGVCVVLNQSPNCHVFGDCIYDYRLFEFGGEIDAIDRLDAEALGGGGSGMEIDVLESPNPSSSLCPCMVERATRTENIASMYREVGARIKPAACVAECIPEGIEAAYGIHLRRTDKVGDGKDLRHENSVAEFSAIVAALMADIREIIGREDRPRFFLCSEDAEWKAEFGRTVKAVSGKVEFVEPDKGCVNQDPAARTRERAMAGFDAVLDMFCLSRCKEILQGVKYSTFSMVSAIVGGRPLRNYASKTDTDDICLVYTWEDVIRINGSRGHTKSRRAIDLIAKDVAPIYFYRRLAA